MSDIQFECPKCGHNLIVDDQGAGLSVSCPECHEQIVIPNRQPPADKPDTANTTAQSKKATEEANTPDAVHIAVTLLYICLAVGVARGLLEAMAAINTLVALGTMLFFIQMMRKRQNWARLTYLVLFILGAPLSIRPLMHSLAVHPLSGFLGIGELALQIVALVLLFHKSASAWFRRPVGNIGDGYIASLDNCESMSAEAQINAMRQEISRLRDRMRNVLFACAILILMLIFWFNKNEKGQTLCREMRAERYYVVDSKGKDRAMLGINNDGSVGLSLHDTKGQMLSMLGSDPNGTSVLAIYDKKEKMRAMLGVGPDGSAALSFLDANENGRASLEMQADGVSKLHIKDSAGHTRAQLMADDEGIPALTLFGKNGNILAVLWAHDDAPYGLTLWGTNGNSGAMLALEHDGRPVLSLSGVQTNSRIWAGVDDSGNPSMHMVGKGSLIWSAPITHLPQN